MYLAPEEPRIPSFVYSKADGLRSAITVEPKSTIGLPAVENVHPFESNRPQFFLREGDLVRSTFRVRGLLGE